MKNAIKLLPRDEQEYWQVQADVPHYIIDIGDHLYYTAQRLKKRLTELGIEVKDLDY